MRKPKLYAYLAQEFLGHNAQPDGWTVIYYEHEGLEKNLELIRAPWLDQPVDIEQEVIADILADKEAF